MGVGIMHENLMGLDLDPGSEQKEGRSTDDCVVSSPPPPSISIKCVHWLPRTQHVINHNVMYSNLNINASAVVLLTQSLGERIDKAL